MSYPKFWLVDRKYGYEQFDPVNWWNMNPEIKFQPNILTTLDRMQVSLLDQPYVDVHPTFAKQLGIQITREAEHILCIKGLQKWHVCIRLWNVII